MSTEREGHHKGHIGPNAIIRLGEAVCNLKGESAGRALFEAAGLDRYLTNPPQTMVPESEVKALHRALFAMFPEAEAERLLRVAGVLTARYLLANRVPPLAQTLIRTLPKPLGGRFLLGTIQKNAWTFAGSAEVTADRGQCPALLMQKCQLCAGLHASARPCRYHEATMETLFRALVSSRTEVTLSPFSASRERACAIEISW